MNKKVTVITVTYGNRFDFLYEVIKSCIAEGVNKIIVVDNNSHSESKTKLKKLLLTLNFEIKVIWNNDNLGSAGGYKLGLQKALEDKTSEFIWLLDDDNKPQTEALNNLKFYWKEHEINKEKTCLLSLRPERKEFVQISKGVNQRFVFPLINSFVGFHLGAYLAHKIFPNSQLRKSNSYCHKVPYAPYGGMFFHISSLNLIGLPNQSFFLYSDDHDFSYRFTNKANGIYLVSSSIVTDIDESWYLKEKKSMIANFIKGENIRVYYSLRNRIVFEKKYFIDNKFVYFTNKTIVLLVFKIATLFESSTNWKIIKKAIKDADRLRLGKISND